MLLAACVAGALLALAPFAQAGRTATLSLTVTFTANGVVTVTLPDGTPVGSTSGAATVIPAGFYSLNMFGPGECINLPLFALKGSGVNIEWDMRGGEVERETLSATFLPNTTYTWHLDRTAGVVHTFRTSADVVGTQAAAQPTAPPKSSGRAESQDVVGAGLLPLRGTITAAVAASGRLTFSYRGKSVTRLKPGRYTVTVVDRSSSNGFLLEKQKKKATVVTGTTYVGKRSAKLTLNAGTWFVLPRPGKTAYSFTVAT